MSGQWLKVLTFQEQVETVRKTADSPAVFNLLPSRQTYRLVLPLWCGLFPRTFGRVFQIFIGEVLDNGPLANVVLNSPELNPIERLLGPNATEVKRDSWKVSKPNPRNGIMY